VGDYQSLFSVQKQKLSAASSSPHISSFCRASFDLLWYLLLRLLLLLLLLLQVVKMPKEVLHSAVTSRCSTAVAAATTQPPPSDSKVSASMLGAAAAAAADGPLPRPPHLPPCSGGTLLRLHLAQLTSAFLQART
jgi:hypothetical protein